MPLFISLILFTILDILIAIHSWLGIANLVDRNVNAAVKTQTEESRCGIVSGGINQEFSWYNLGQVDIGISNSLFIVFKMIADL